LPTQPKASPAGAHSALPPARRLHAQMRSLSVTVCS